MLDRSSIRLIRANETKLKSYINEKVKRLSSHYKKFPWNLVKKVPRTYDNTVVNVVGNSYTIKSLKKEISTYGNTIKTNIRPTASHAYISTYKKEALHALRAGGDINKVYNSVKSLVDANFNKYDNQIKFCLAALKVITKYLKEKDKIMKESYFDLDFIYETKRSNLDDSEFGISDKRKFPLDTKDHVKSAAKFFNYADDSDKDELARKIKKKAKEYDIQLNPGDHNTLSKYMRESTIKQLQNTNESEEINIMESIFASYPDELKDMLLESYEALNESDLDDDDFEATEGANLNMRAAFKGYKKQIKGSFKDYKMNIKAGHLNAAKKNMTDVINVIDKAEKDITSIQSDAGSIWSSWFVDWTVDLGHVLLTGLSLAIPVVGLPIFIITRIKDINNYISGIKTKGKLGGTGAGVDDWNTYKGEILKVLERYKKIAQTNIQNLSSANSQNNAELNAKESEELEESILEIYSLCQEGVISIDEREEMCKELRDSYYENKMLNDSYYEAEIDNVYMTKNEKFNRVKRALYEKAHAGEITESEREELINAAWDRIYEAEDQPEPEMTEEESKKFDAPSEQEINNVIEKNKNDK